MSIFHVEHKRNELTIIRKGNFSHLMAIHDVMFLVPESMFLKLNIGIKTTPTCIYVQHECAYSRLIWYICMNFFFMFQDQLCGFNRFRLCLSKNGEKLNWRYINLETDPQIQVQFRRFRVNGVGNRLIQVSVSMNQLPNEHVCHLVQAYQIYNKHIISDVQYIAYSRIDD